MNKSTKIVGVDCKIGRKSRTGSTVTMSIDDEHVVDCVDYFKAFDAGKEPVKKIKSIELVMIYEEDLNAQTIEGEIEETIINIDDSLDAVNEEVVKRALEYCPKCNEELLIIGWKDDNKYHITCSKCETSVSGESIEEAETKWNTREAK